MKELLKEFASRVDVMAFLVGLTVMGVFLIMVLALIYVPIPSENRDSLTLLIGIVSGGVGTIVGYYFGSSKGSQKKSDLIEKITETK
jgi:hypothetical protein